MTPNQLVAYNLRRIRQAVDAAQIDGGRTAMTQTEAAEEAKEYLGELWSRQRWSSAESSATATEEDGIRGFDADELFAFALAFDVPLTWFFLPPDEALPLDGNYPDPDITVKVGSETVSADQLLTTIFEKRMRAEMVLRLESLFRRQSDGGVFSDKKSEAFVTGLLDRAYEGGSTALRMNASSEARAAREELRALESVIERQRSLVAALEQIADNDPSTTDIEE